MSITVDWDDNEKSVIRCEFDAIWTWNDVFAMNRTIEALMDTVQHPVNVMIIMRGKNFPQSGTLTYTKHLFVHEHVNYGRQVVFVGGTILIKTFERIIRKAYVKAMSTVHSEYVDTIESARTLLAAHDTNSSFYEDIVQ